MLAPVRALLLVAALRGGLADIYLHGPRGSNDRNCEKNVNRNNGNRLFDSQNNAKGGYACPRAVGNKDRGNTQGIAPFIGGVNNRMYYYEGSKLTVEWTTQHGCGGNGRVQCQMIIQYACEDTLDPYFAGSYTNGAWPSPASPEDCPNTPNKQPGVAGQCYSRNSVAEGCTVATPRDGIPANDGDAATDTIPNNVQSAIPNSDNTLRYGMHETFMYYDIYSHTERNRGLWTADQNVRRRDARGTRQNPNGNRRGLEVPEERDYYPYWGPSPWRDIAVLSNVIQLTDSVDYYCNFVRAESQNVKEKYFCEADNKGDSDAWNRREWHNNRADCESDDQLVNGRWMFLPSFATLADDDDAAALNNWRPECKTAPLTRTNQLGNAALSAEQKAEWDPSIPPTTAASRYIWTVPMIDDLRPGARGSAQARAYFPSSDCSPELSDIEVALQSCVLRLRYNISTGDLDQWPAEMDGSPDFATARNNSRINNQDNPNSPLEQDPYTTLPSITTGPSRSFLSFAVNTNQYGRTFQDRSYTFAIKKRPSAAEAVPYNRLADEPGSVELRDCDVVVNVNLRGKRGNIVQTYPAVEYDFIPDQICAQCSRTVACPGSGTNAKSFVHFQFTGSDYNPRRGCNNGEGGPPDPNPNGRDTNNNNARADRTNLAFVSSPFNEASNVLVDSGALTSVESYIASQEEWPCADTGGTADTLCKNQMFDLVFLRQGAQGAQGLQTFNGARDCLSQQELDSINNKNARENHPRNCAKLNMRAAPYFDGGLVEMRNCGKKFAFFSTRNNNFSNRDQTGSLAIRAAGSDTATCTFGGSTPADPFGFGELDPITVASNTVSPLSTAPVENLAPCQEPGEGEANNNGASSCIVGDEEDILEDDSFTIEEADSDVFGDGNARGCEELVFFLSSGTTVEEQVGLAIGLLFVGIAAAWGGVYGYNRWRKKQSAPASASERSWHAPAKPSSPRKGVSANAMI